MTHRLTITLAAALLPLACLQGLSQEVPTQADIIRLQRTVLALQRQVDSLMAAGPREGPRRPDGGSGVISSTDGTLSLWSRLIGSVDDAVATDAQARLLCIPRWLDTGDGEEVLRYVDLYCVRWRSRMERVMARYSRYEEDIRRAFGRRGVPPELAPLCIVESAVDPLAVSRAGAVGLWQIMPATGRSMGMEIGEGRDDRLDPALSTEVAAAVLSRAYQILGDWRLAVMSYNCGVGAVQRAIRENGGRRDYEGVASRLPRETQAYIPSLIGVLCYMDSVR